MTTSLQAQGFAVIPGLFTAPQVAQLTRILETHPAIGADGAGHALRNLFDAIPELAPAAAHEAVRRLVEPVLGTGCFPVRAIYFDKPPGANWKVPWHQDQSIAVKQRRDVPGFGPWSVKQGVVHVEPPATVLAEMLTVRLHLDDCGEDNGPLRVVPGSHRLGRLSPDAARKVRDESGEVSCTTMAGGVVLMRPLLLHASSPAVNPSHRRVIHMEFASRALPGGLEWAFR